MRIIVGILLLASVYSESNSFAAYLDPVVISNERERQGQVRVRFEFTGNAGEPTVRRDYIVQQNSTAASLRNWVDDTIKELQLLHTAANLAILQPGQTITRLPRITPTMTAKQLWVRNHENYLRIKDSDILATATERATLKAWLETNYQSGYLALD